MSHLYSVHTLSEKTSIYATLVGILNAKKYDFGEEVNGLIVEYVIQSWREGGTSKCHNNVMPTIFLTAA